MLIQNILREEQTNYLAAARYERDEDRVDFRNGYYTRDIESSLGLIKNIKVPRNRITSYESILFKKYKRKEVSYRRGQACKSLNLIIIDGAPALTGLNISTRNWD